MFKFWCGKARQAAGWIVVLGVMTMGAGCTSELPLATPAENGPTTSGLPDGGTQSLLGCLTVVSQLVFPGVPSTVSGGRYMLQFGSQSLPYPALVTVTECDPLLTSGLLPVVLFELGPDGIQFNAPVRLTINYAGTRADPSSPDYDGTHPAVYWLNPLTLSWVLVPGTNDPEKRIVTVELGHFSIYAVANKGDGTAEWQPARERSVLNKK